ncbi:MAG: hypothetical protein ACLUEQ_00430 [Cloacibacillus evryensis]
MDIREKIAKILPEITAFRRALHEYPDLSGEEADLHAHLGGAGPLRDRT